MSHVPACSLITFGRYFLSLQTPTLSGLAKEHKFLVDVCLVPDPVLSTVQNERTFTLSECIIYIGGKQTLKRASDVIYQ